MKKARMEYDQQAKMLVQTMTLEEKIGLLSGKRSREDVLKAIRKKTKVHYNEETYAASGCIDKHVPILFFADGSRGVVCDKGKYTCFPVAVLRGASFDKELERRIGHAIGQEVLAAGGNLFGGVCVNIPYHPGWGRSQESYGEDPYHVGMMGAAMVQGVQETGVIACVKHYALNSMENARFVVSIFCDRQTEREVFLPQFKRCIDAGAGALMTAYNSYEGICCGEHSYLIRDVLKKEWDFDGFVLSDFNWGIKDMVRSIESGMDLEMPMAHYFGDNLIEAVKSGIVKEALIDEAACRIVRTTLCHTDLIKKGKNRQLHSYKPAEHYELAVESARAGITLLKNNAEILPIKLGKKIQKIAVIGKTAEEEITGDRGSSQVYPPYIISILNGIREIVQNADVIYYPGESLVHCKKLAKEADIVIFTAGNTYETEGERISYDKNDVLVSHIGGDRTQGLSLKKEEIDKIRAVAEIRSDAIVVLHGGSAITMEEWHDSVGAIVFQYYAGMEGGRALAEILFGKVNPSGKLPFVIPRKESHLPTVNFSATRQNYEYFHGYKLLDQNDIRPRYPFGHGLSYTTFEIEEKMIKCLRNPERAERAYAVFVGVRNTGQRAGAEVIQVYVEKKNSRYRRPIRKLVGFEKVFLKAGEEKDVEILIMEEDLLVYDMDREKFVLEEGEYVLWIGNSSKAGASLPLLISD